MGRKEKRKKRENGTGTRRIPNKILREKYSDVESNEEKNRC